MVAGNPCRKFAYTLCRAVNLLLGTVNRCAEAKLITYIKAQFTFKKVKQDVINRSVNL